MAKVTVVDPKGKSFTEFIKNGFVYVHWYELLFNVLHPPPNVPLAVWIPKIAEAMCEALRLLEASWGHLSEIIKILYQKSQHTHTTPCFKELYEEVFSGKYDSGLTRKYQEPVANKIQILRNTLSDVLCCRRGFMEDLVKNHSFVLDLAGLSNLPQQFLTLCLFTWVYLYHCFNLPRGIGLQRLMIQDEGHHVVFNTALQNSAKGSSSSIEQVVALSREFGLGWVVAAQRPTAILDEILSDSFLRLTFNLGSGDEVMKMQRAIGLSPTQANMVRHMDVGTAAAKMSGGYTFPTLIQCYNPEMSQPTEEDWQKNKKILDELRSLAEPDPMYSILNRPVEADIRPNAKALLLAVGNHPNFLTMELYTQARLENNSGNAAKRQLERDGFIKVEKIKGAGSGSAQGIYLTEKGKQAYRNFTGGKECKELEKTQRAGFLHDFWVSRIVRYFENATVEVESGRMFGNQEADIFAKHNEKTICYEVTFSFNNLNNKLDLLDHVDRVVYLCENQAAIRKAKKKVSIPKEIAERVSFLPLKDFL